MKPAYIQISSTLMIALAFVVIGFLYAVEPKSIAEVSTKGSVAIGSYQVDAEKRERGLELFRSENYAAARSFLTTADPEKRDAVTQFYVAYSYYREGWGRIANDDQLFLAGVEACSTAIALDPNFRSTDPALLLKTAQELKSELEEGLKITASDFNPLKMVRERK